MEIQLERPEGEELGLQDNGEITERCVVLTMYIVYILKKRGHKAVEVAESRVLSKLQKGNVT
jgi:hypothetical protein